MLIQAQHTYSTPSFDSAPQLLLAPYNSSEEWQIEAERQGSVIFLNVKEPESSLRRQVNDAMDPRKRAMQYWGFAWEEVCSSGGAGLSVGIDSTEGFNSVAISNIGNHRLIVASEIDTILVARAAPPEASASSTPMSSSRMANYCELKTTRLMDTPRQAREGIWRAERDRDRDEGISIFLRDVLGAGV